MATVARHQDISDRFLEHAEEEFEKGDLLQASEKTWGAVAHCVKSIARKHGWPSKSHRDVSNNADRLIRLTEDARQNQRLFHVVTNLHVNFYEDTYADKPDVVKHGIEDARTLIAAMKEAEARLPRPRES